MTNFWVHNSFKFNFHFLMQQSRAENFHFPMKQSPAEIRLCPSFLLTLPVQTFKRAPFFAGEAWTTCFFISKPTQDTVLSPFFYVRTLWFWTELLLCSFRMTKNEDHWPAFPQRLTRIDVRSICETNIDKNKNTRTNKQTNKKKKQKNPHSTELPCVHDWPGLTCGQFAKQI